VLLNKSKDFFEKISGVTPIARVPRKTVQKYKPTYTILVLSPEFELYKWPQ
jgi:hypothetical protein